MAQRSSRKKNRSTEKKPHLRTGGGTAAKRDRRASRTPEASQRVPTAPIRPEGTQGAIIQSLGGWFTIGLFLLVSLWFDRWMTYGYPDSLWWMIALGGLVAAPAVGWISRSGADALTWSLQVLVVAAGVLAYQVWTGPTCAVDQACGVIGAQGSFGRVGSVIALVVVAAITWYLALFFFGWADRRRTGDVGSVGSALKGMIWPILLATFPLMLIVIPADAALRPEPGHAKQAIEQVAQYCFDDAAAVPDLKLRPSPEPTSTYYSTYLVRRAAENRKLPKGTPKAATGPYLDRPIATPYEAQVAFNANGDQVFLACRRIDKDAGLATADDLAAPAYGEQENPFKPQDVLTQPSATPAPVAKPKAKAKAKAKAAAKK